MTFSIFSCFLHIQPVVFKPSDKAVILSGALHRFTAWHSACDAESKDLKGAYPTYAVRPLSTTETRPADSPPDHQVRTAGRALFSGLGGQKAPNSIDRIRSSRSFDSAPQALCHAIHL